MKMFFSLGLTLIYSSLSLAQLMNIDEIKQQLHNTQWTGLAGVRVVGSYQIVNDVNMAFQIHEGKIFYLSKINDLLDGQIEKKAQGLCVKSPPREAVLYPSADGKKLNGRVILPELIAATGDHKFYSIPVLDFVLNGSLLTFGSIPLTIAKKGMNVSYRLNKVDSAVTRELALELQKCLETKPWLKR